MRTLCSAPPPLGCALIGNSLQRRAGGETALPIIDGQAPIQPLVDFDISSYITAALLIWRNLQLVLGKAHHIVQPNSSQILEAKDRICVELFEPWAIGAALLSGGHRKLGIEAWQ